MFGLKVRWNNKDYQYHQWEPKAKFIDFKKDDIDFSIINEFISNFKSTIKKYFNDWEIEEIPDNFNDDMIKLIFNSFEKREDRDQELTSSLFLEALKIYMKNQYESSNTQIQNFIQPSVEIIYVRYTGYSQNQYCFDKDIIPEYFYIKKENERWRLYVVEKILNKQPSPEYEILLSKFFDFEKSPNPQKYELIEPALIEWNEIEDKGHLIKKGLIKQI